MQGTSKPRVWPKVWRNDISACWQNSSRTSRRPSRMDCLLSFVLFALYECGLLLPWVLLCVHKCFVHVPFSSLISVGNRWKRDKPSDLLADLLEGLSQKSEQTHPCCKTCK